MCTKVIKYSGRGFLKYIFNLCARLAVGLNKPWYESYLNLFSGSKLATDDFAKNPSQEGRVSTEKRTLTPRFDFNFCPHLLLVNLTIK